MLAVVLYGKEDLRLEKVTDPVPGVGELVIEVNAATTCGTDLKVWRRGGHAKMLRPPTVFGHEAAGRIVALGEGVSGWKIGDRVVPNNSAPCMNCFFCQRQEFSLCNRITWNNGTFAEYLKIPAQIVQYNLLPIPDELPDAIAAMTEPLACVLHGVARSQIQPNSRVLILGDGAIGLMFVAVLARQVRDIWLIGGNQPRLEIGSKFGASQTFNYHQYPGLTALVKDLTEGRGADIVIEATGVPSVWEQAIACVRPGGVVNLFGGCPKDTHITINTEQLHYSELTIKGVFHNTPKYVRQALNLLTNTAIPWELLISDRRPLQDLEQVFQDMQRRKVIKVAISQI
ncbi:zinc-dependent alcohol dehydrogenase [Merismopedia glauca]|uniref:Dehydrogenase n=1 Tax=Merismopedia glauca CCAP 1448/3 TaxID=1296344 RepID=A0A2T1C7H8_9CYAN|nr:alcohol dehydrogenase catalytic domain-containing protein [Merismopedia glauca]PSB04220.1 dehydrogenase [Merismopedia glauca CCAP 1448/3]